MEITRQDTKVTEKLGFGMLLASIGGIMDMYTYTVRGKVFATGQTGNFVLAAVRLAEQDYIGMFHALVPIIAFWLGIFTAWHIFYSYCKDKQLIWQRIILITALFILFITGLIPLSYPDIIADSLVAFAASLQYCAFRKFGEGDNYASIFCSGNMRSCAENYYKGLVQKDKQSLKRALKYTCILLSFFTGAVLGTILSFIFHEKSIWFVMILISTALIISYDFNGDILNILFLLKSPKEQ